MKKSTFALGLILSMASFSIQSFTSPALTRKTIDVAPFTGVHLSGSHQVFIQQGSSQKVEVEGDADLIKTLNKKVSNDIWHISTSKRGNWKTTGMKIYITLPKVTHLMLSGSGEIIGENNIKSSDLEVKVTGSGKIKATVNASNLNALVSGSGSITMEGNADNLKQTITGSGDFWGSNIKVKNAQIQITGSGDSELQVSGNLTASITGSGDVYYYGSPSVQSRITGSGRVQPK